MFEGWRPWSPRIDFTAEVASKIAGPSPGWLRVSRIRSASPRFDEWPGDVIPLPEGYQERARGAAGAVPRHLALYHFDPYSVAFRFIARGDEPDYHLVLTVPEHGWISVEEMHDRLAALLPKLTAETIQQDPAEFRRKYKGLLQMWEAVRPRTTHRSTRV